MMSIHVMIVIHCCCYPRMCPGLQQVQVQIAVCVMGSKAACMPKIEVLFLTSRSRSKICLVPNVVSLSSGNSSLSLQITICTACHHATHPTTRFQLLMHQGGSMAKHRAAVDAELQHGALEVDVNHTPQ